MKQRKIFLYSVLVGTCLFILIVFSGILNNFFREPVLVADFATAKKACYVYKTEKFSNFYLYKLTANHKKQFVMGSSELSTTFLPQHPKNLYNHINDYDIYIQGQGHQQSLTHAITLASFDEILNPRKVVFIVSPQWFTKDGIEPQAFQSNFSYYHYVRMLNNNKISVELKRRITKRVEQLEAIESVTPFEDINIGVNKLTGTLKKPFTQLKQNKLYSELYELAKDKPQVNIEYKSIKSLDWNNLLKSAETDGKKASTNNEFGIYDDYFNKYVKSKLVQKKNSAVNDSFTVSKEYDDLKLFLDICKELSVEVMMISVPVNGRWYDYTGFPKENREKYYQNIRDMADEYNVKLADFSNYEYEKYFLADVMHLGWKGWIRVNEAIYRFYIED